MRRTGWFRQIVLALNDENMIAIVWVKAVDPRPVALERQRRSPISA